MTTVDSAATREELRLALLGPKAAGGPRRSVKLLLQAGRRGLSVQIGQLPEAEQADAESLATKLAADGTRALLCDDPRFPDRLRSFRGSPPALFYRGNIALLAGASIGVCGSRNASAEGLRAARACGEDAARAGVTVVSGYAKGVDTESHLAALTAGGRTVTVLAEGIDHFKIKQAYRDLPTAAMERLLVLSQFPPTQRWTASAAMTRNGVIIGLSQALIVVEAGETGGTIRAGEVALQSGRPTWVLGLPASKPVGNEKLVAAGGSLIENRVELLARLRELNHRSSDQLTFE